MKLYFFLLITLCVFYSSEIPAQQKPTTGAVDVIKMEELKRDLYAMADDRFKGRESGTLDELKVSVWLAEQVRLAGLEPAGDDGTFFQFFSLQRTRLSSLNSSVTAGDRSYLIFKDALPMISAAASVAAPTVYIADFAAIASLDLKDKIAVVPVSSQGINQNVSIPGRRYFRSVYQKYAPALINKGVAAIILIGDEEAEKNWNAIAPVLQRGNYRVDVPSAQQAVLSSAVPALWLHTSEHDFFKTTPTVTIKLVIESFEYPSVNIVGKIPGTDAKLKKEYVLFSAHHDHDGIRSAVNNDSIYNGADDNASGSVALLGIARAFRKKPARRSALFVWHGAEERSMLGSRWFANFPSVPKADIAAVLNADMIGQNHPDSMALLGSQSPHKNSSDLVAAALEANDAGPQFKLDVKWDKTDHPEGFYFRSDHMPYARVGIPAIFYTSLLHPIYHTPADEAKTINYPKLLKVTQWMYLTGWAIGNTTERPKVDEGFKLER